MNVIGTAGHVDHGKSTLVRALTGMDPDRFEEEKRRGLTIDLGFAWFTLPSGRDVSVVDVPGHERFIRNMLAGVGGIDAVLFVVAADEGWMPQSAEHLQILDFLEVPAGVVALTKVDAAEDGMAAIAAEEVRERLAGSILEDAPIVEVSALTGHGIDDLCAELDRIVADAGGAVDHQRPRLFVDRAFTMKGAGTVVTGTLTGGRLAVDDEIELLPSGRRARIRTLQTHRESVEEAVPGSRVAANLVGLDKQDVRRGDAVVLPDGWRTTDTFVAKLRTARDLTHPLAEKGAYELYVGAAEVPCRLRFLEDVPTTAGRAPVAPPGTELFVQIFCMRPVPLEPMDRFIVRDVGRWETVAGGVILDQDPGPIRRGEDALISKLRAREQADPVELVRRVAVERGLVPRAELGPLTGAGPAEVDAAIAAGVLDGDLVATSSYIASADRADELAARLRETLSEHHLAHPLEPGMAKAATRSALELEPRPFEELLGHFVDEGTVIVDGATLRLPGHAADLDPEQRTQADAALGRLRAAGVTPPALPELDLPADLVRALERRGELVLVTPDIGYDADTLRGIEDRVVTLIASEGPATVAQVRDAIGTSRKYAVPLLEHLDSKGITQRTGDTRALGPEGRRRASG